MKKLLLAACAALLFSSSSLAKGPTDVMVLKNGDLIVTLTKAPCTAKIDLPKKEQWKNADVLYQGKEIKACWIVPQNDQEYVLVVDETGDGGFIPKDSFKPATGL